MINYPGLSDYMLKLLALDGDQGAKQEQTRRSMMAKEKAEFERAEADRQQYIKRRGGEPHVPNRKSNGQ